MDWNDLNYYFQSKKSYWGLKTFRLCVTNYMLHEYDIPNIFEMTCSEDMAKFINETMNQNYNSGNSVGDTAKILADYIKGIQKDKV